MSAHAAEYVRIPGGPFAGVIRTDTSATERPNAPYKLRSEPVTNAEFLAFVAAHAEWRRDRVKPGVAESPYLVLWKSPTELGESLPSQPVVGVSWFAARAFCASEGARLPTWREWEFVAAADATRADARSDPAWRASILSWYARPSSDRPASIGGAANFYGVRDLHGLIWEWVDDFNMLFMAGEGHDHHDSEPMMACGAAALNLRDPGNYPMVMRVALLSSLKPTDTTSNLGFRCAKQDEGG
jgi:formylglycine-generating enzyme required for sulfatase activity